MDRRLRLLIIGLYGTQSKFARACGRSESWLSRIITGVHEPSEQDKKLIAQHLKIENIERYFLKEDL